MAIYVGARDLAGVPVGTHQFIVIFVSSSPHPAALLNGNAVYPKSVGKKMAYVVGAQNRGGLQIEYFEKSDYSAALEYFDRKAVNPFASDFDTEIREVKFQGVKIELAIVKILQLINNFYTNQFLDKIVYPAGGLGYNSNSWVQSVIELAGGELNSDFSGFDYGNKKRIPKTYFEPVCPISRRPKLN